MIVTQNTKLNIVPGGILPVVHVSQYDVDRVLSFTLYDGNGAASIESGTTVTIEGTKPDGNGFQYAGTLSENVVTVNTTAQMTALEGTNECKLTLKKGTQTIGSALFLMEVEKAGINENTPVSETDLPLIITQATEQMERAEAAAANAENSEIIAGSAMRMAGNYAEIAEQASTICTSILPVVQGYKESAENSAIIAGSSMRIAGNYAEEAEAQAVGKRGGVDVPSTDPTYHNNAKYWAYYASQYAQGGLVYKGSILFANIPTTGMVNGDMYNMEDDFTTDSRFQEGAGVFVKAGTNIAWNGSKWDVLATGGGGTSGEIISYADWQQLTPEQQASGDYYIPDYPVTASTMPVAGFDTAPTQGSFAPVTSDGIYRAIQPISGSIQSIGGRVSDIEDEIGNTDISGIGQTITGAINNLGSIDVLWTNTRPLENFVSQTISINTLNSYKAIGIIAEAAVNMQFYSTIYIYKDFGDGLNYLIHCPHVDTSTGLAYTGIIRECVVYWSTNQIHFGQGKYGTSNNRNDTGIPVMIIGIGK